MSAFMTTFYLFVEHLPINFAFLCREVSEDIDRDLKQTMMATAQGNETKKRKRAEQWLCIMRYKFLNILEPSSGKQQNGILKFCTFGG